MNSEQPDYIKKSKQVIKGTFKKNVESKSSVLYLVPSDSEISSEKSRNVRLRQMKKVKSGLKMLPQEYSNQLFGATPENTRFLSIIAHDLRSPFCSILLALEFINDNLDHNTINDIKEYVKVASDAAKTSLELLNELFAWAIFQNKDKEINPVKINLFELLNEKFEILNISARQKQIKLSHTISPGLNVRADLQMVKAILRNLISNAIKYSETGSEIVVGANRTGRFVEIIVKDNGPGISVIDQRTLFKNDPVKSYGDKNYINGLGLLLCREFVELHGGKITIDSESGLGSEFKFTLPY